FFPARIPLALALERLRGPDGEGAGYDPRNVGLGRDASRLASVTGAESDGLAARVGRPMARYLVDLPLPTRVRSDLLVLGRSPERHLAEKTTLAIVGLLLVPALAGLLALGGTPLSW